MNQIVVENLTRDYGNKKGVFDVSLTIPQGEVFGFLGPNGAGKTTTIRHLMGFLRSEKGICKIGGLDCWKDREKIQFDLGYIPGEIAVFDDMTGAEYLKFILKYRGLKNYGKANELLRYFELEPKIKIKKMSKGMKQKIGIISAFMHDPSILILDEPTAGLDPLMQSRFIELIKQEKVKGKTILMSSHIFEEVERTCDRIGIIKNGVIVAMDSTETLRKRHSKSYVVTLETPDEAKSFAKDFGGVQDGFLVTVDRRQTLDEIFMQYYGGNIGV